MVNVGRRQFLKGLGLAGAAAVGASVPGRGDTPLYQLKPPHALWSAVFEVATEAPEYLESFVHMGEPPWMRLPSVAYPDDALGGPYIDLIDGQYCYNDVCFDPEHVIFVGGDNAIIDNLERARASVQEKEAAFTEIGLQGSKEMTYYVNTLLPHPTEERWLRAELSDNVHIGGVHEHVIDSVFVYGEASQEEAERIVNGEETVPDY